MLVFHTSLHVRHAHSHKQNSQFRSCLDSIPKPESLYTEKTLILTHSSIHTLDVKYCIYRSDMGEKRGEGGERNHIHLVIYKLFSDAYIQSFIYK